MHGGLCIHKGINEVYAAREKNGIYIPRDSYLQEEAEKKAMTKKIERMELESESKDKVEYQPSDTNLVASDFLMKIMNKDPEGCVPMSVIASWKKIKSFGVNHQTLVKALKTSTKLVVNADGKKVKRKHAFTERDREELQGRMVMVENLPDDYSRQNIEKIFGVVGRVKNIRICHPQEPNASNSSKSDMFISNKLHAFVEYETPDQADKAVEQLNDERNWRKGLRVRSMARRSPRSVIRTKRSVLKFGLICGVRSTEWGCKWLLVVVVNEARGAGSCEVSVGKEDDAFRCKRGVCMVSWLSQFFFPLFVCVWALVNWQS